MNCFLSKTSSFCANRGVANFVSRRGLSSVTVGRRSNYGQSSSLNLIPRTPQIILTQASKQSTENATTSSKNFSTLADVLQREITEEVENPLNEMPEDLSELKAKISADWTIVDGTASSADGATVKMYKKKNLTNGAKVTITFHCQDSLNPEELGFFQSAAHAASDTMGAGGEEEDEEMSSPFKFDVTVSRAGKVMHLSCTSEAAEATIDGVTMSNSEEDVENGDLYRGPLLEDLPEDVRDGLDLYLQEQCGVDEDVAAFIAMYADYREQVEYINWLKSVKNIVS